MLPIEDHPQDNSHQSWYVGNLVFHLSLSSIFHVPVDCIVNSENNLFQLAHPGGNSISSQLAEKFNPHLQHHLYEKTGGEEQPTGSVVESPGYGSYERIFHAGHQPHQVWTSEVLTDEERANHFRIIRKCIAEILHRFGESDSESIAFPLIGCGAFDLDPWLYGHEFMHELIEQASDPKFSGKEVWLVVFEEDRFPVVLNGLTQTLSDRARHGQPWEPFDLGVSYIDQFEETAFGTRHPRWIGWLLVRYVELVTGHLLYLLASAQSTTPRTLIEPNRPVCFGVLRDSAYNLAKNYKGVDDNFGRPWVKELARTVYSHSPKLKKLNEDRNHIAHGRRSRSMSKMFRDVTALVDDLGPLFRDNNSTPPPDKLKPWTYVTDSNKVGVLDRWREEKVWRYLLPADRRLIEVPVPH